jgi:predicted transcriptional regulator
MRNRAEWMVPADDPILEYFQIAGETTASVTARNIDIHRKYASRRIKELAEYGLLEPTEKNFYRLTELGEKYLAGELDAGTLESEDASDEEDE